MPRWKADEWRYRESEIRPPVSKGTSRLVPGLQLAQIPAVLLQDLASSTSSSGSEHGLHDGDDEVKR